MAQNKSNIALLLGDPAGIGPELISKLLNDEMTKKANIVIIGEKQVFETGNNITGISHNIDIVENSDYSLLDGTFYDINELPAAATTAVVNPYFADTLKN